jgi:hypothetical protein
VVIHAVVNSNKSFEKFNLLWVVKLRAEVTMACVSVCSLLNTEHFGMVIASAITIGSTTTQNRLLSGLFANEAPL